MRELTRHTWALHLCTIGCCAFFAARATGQLMAGFLEDPTDPAAGGARQGVAVPAAGEGAPSRATEPIVSRNIFCSSCEPVLEQPAQDPMTSTGGMPVRTQLKLQLLATLVSIEDPATSVAYILDTEKSQTRLYGIGARVAEASIIEVAARQVLLLNGGRQEYLPLGEGEGNASMPQPGATVASAGFAMPEPLSGLEAVADGIRRVGGTKYTIQRSMMNKVFADPNMLARAARLVPSLKDGAPNGFAVYAKPGSLPSLLGLFNGDVLQAINGHAITTPDRALEVMKTVRNASHLNLSFVRKGVTLTHEYDIQ